MARAGTVTVGRPTTRTFTGAGAQPASDEPDRERAPSVPNVARHGSSGAMAASRYGASHVAAVAVRWLASR